MEIYITCLPYIKTFQPFQTILNEEFPARTNHGGRQYSIIDSSPPEFFSFLRARRTLKNKDEIYDKIYPTGSKPASIYGLPKIHKFSSNKDNLSLRPTISSMGTHKYNLSKFLINLLAFVIPTASCTKDSFTFCEEIKKVRATNKFLIFMMFAVCLQALP